MDSNTPVEKVPCARISLYFDEQDLPVLQAAKLAAKAERKSLSKYVRDALIKQPTKVN